MRTCCLLPLLLMACASEHEPAEDIATTDQGIADARLGDVSEPDAPWEPDLGPDLPEVSDALPPPDVLTEVLADTPPLTDSVNEEIQDTTEDLPPDMTLEDSVDTEDTVDTVEEVFTYSWEPSAPCGTTAYNWQPPSAVGEVVSWLEEPSYNLTPEFIELLLTEAGYPELITVNNGTRVFRMRYLTQDHGVLTEATAMVGIPDLPPGDGLDEPTATILFLHPTMGYANHCAPSGGLEGAAAALLPASMGYISVAPDYIGMCGSANPCEDVPHPYLIGEPTAIAAWDSVRAAHALLESLDEELMIIPDGQVVPWGVSQGGHAALFTDRYGPIYAPEFEIPCTIAVVPPGNLVGQAELALDALDSAAKLGTAFLIAAALWYEPEAGPESLFNAYGPKDYATWLLETFPTTCSENKFMEGASSIDDLYNPDFLAEIIANGLASVDPWGCIALENSIPTAPVPYQGNSKLLYLLAENDNLVDHMVERATVQTLCDDGYQIDFLECAGGSHTGTAFETVQLQVNWLTSCLAEEGPAEEELCVIGEPVDCGAL